VSRFVAYETLATVAWPFYPTCQLRTISLQMGSVTLVASGSLRCMWLAIRLLHLSRLYDIPLMSNNWTMALLQMFSNI